MWIQTEPAIDRSLEYRSCQANSSKICHGILVIHAFSGCNKTSRIHSVRKPVFLEKYGKSNEFQKLATIFLDPSANKDDIIGAEEQLMLSIVAVTNKQKTMDEKRFADYYKKLKGKPAVKPESLGPSSDASAKHSESVYHTVWSWCGNDLPPEQWGWRMSNGMCLPLQITKPPAPHELLKWIRCGCKIKCTTRWTCITYRLKCQGVSCMYASDERECCVKSLSSATWMWKYNTLTVTASGNTLYSWDCVHFYPCIQFQKLFLNCRKNIWKVPVMELIFSNFAVSLSVYISVAASVNFLFCASLNFSIKTLLLQKVLWSLMQIWYANADFKKSLYVCVHTKTIPWKFRLLNPKNSQVIYPWSL